MFYGQNYTIKSLLEAGVHYGHKKNYWNPKMAQYIYGIKNGIHIIDLKQTVQYLEQALFILKQIASQNGKILFVATKKQAFESIKENAEKCNQYYVNYRWLGGMLTNWKTVSDSINTLRKYEEMLNEEDSLYTKKEKISIKRKYDKLHLALGGIRNMNGVPSVIIVIGVRENSWAVKEAQKLGIPIIAILDSNCNPDGINYIIPGNDDARNAIKLYCELFATAILAGSEKITKRYDYDPGNNENYGDRNYDRNSKYKGTRSNNQRYDNSKNNTKKEDQYKNTNAAKNIEQKTIIEEKTTSIKQKAKENVKDGIEPNIKEKTKEDVNEKNINKTKATINVINNMDNINIDKNIKDSSAKIENNDDNMKNITKKKEATKEDISKEISKFQKNIKNTSQDTNKNTNKEKEDENIVEKSSKIKIKSSK